MSKKFITQKVPSPALAALTGVLADLAAGRPLSAGQVRTAMPAAALVQTAMDMRQDTIFEPADADG